MFLSFIYKEHIKVRWFYASLLALNFIYLIWVFLQVQKLFKLDHSEVVWYRVIGLGQVPFENLIYLPIVCGVAFAFFQFLLEKKDERFRLSLHLPVDNSLIIIAHLIIGILFLGAMFLLDDIFAYLFLSAYFPQSYVFLALGGITTWLICGIISYLCISIILLEPQKTMRIFFLLIFLGVFIPLYKYHKLEQLESLLCLYIILVPLLLLISIISVFHFRLRVG